MSAIVDEAIEELSKLKDQKLMEKYVQNLVGPFPSSVEIKAILHIFGERGIQYQGLELSAKFLHLKNGTVEKIYLKSEV